ncbi:hypothetical protein NL503_30105, partial [Klebsiella pneumoniae]|nr:hypothetical protein [Klebsiella pneumoniae]
AQHAKTCARHGIELIVQRIGSEAALARVRAAGVRLGQGYALGHPVARAARRATGRTAFPNP